MTIQERVQRDKRFTRIGLGVYALTDYLDKLPKAEIPKTKEAEKERKHAIIQGIQMIKNGFLKIKRLEVLRQSKKFHFLLFPIL